MGVPAFFRWLSMRYPKVVIDALSEDDLEYMYDEFKKGSDDPNEIDLLQEGDLDGEIERRIKSNNPEFDNLYLDMNGIIHPCTHPPDKPSPRNETEMFNNIFEYVDKVIKICKPQKLIYMAIDGVAPRAKMNQQRSRRFRSALETEERELRETEIKNKWKTHGIKFNEEKKDDDGQQKFDQNIITPGTEFMWRLSKALQYYVVEHLQNDPLWKGLKIIFSDASIPGEGEHKILDFIRSQRASVGYDPNTRHCIYGADADLIMLGLSTHEPHFCVIREAFILEQDKKCMKCNQQGHFTDECPSNPDRDSKVRLSKSVKFQFIRINVLREYLYLEFKDIQLPFPFDFERIVDDFVFMCFFVGNDFLPHLPSLHIREGAIDSMMIIYKNLLPSMGDYMTKNGEIDFAKVDLMFNDIAKIEEEFFRIQRSKEERFKNNPRDGNNRFNNRGQAFGARGQQQSFNSTGAPRHQKLDEPEAPTDTKPAEEAKESDESKALKELQEQQELTEEELNKLAAEKMKEVVKKMLMDQGVKKAEKYVDKVQFGTDGWKLRYYRSKFHINEQDFEEFTKKIKQSYIEGLQWVYSYYYKGCVSWYWFYPYHYAPFASDLINCERVQIKFELGEPASPFEQLLGVFPKQSAHAIPLCYRHLLSDPNSEIIDFYPTYIRLDINGARYAWMGVNLLPFIDRERLVKAMKKYDHQLTEHEKERNRVGNIYLFFEKKEQSSSVLIETLNKVDHTKGHNLELIASFERKDEISGKVKICKQAIKIGEQVKGSSGFDLGKVDKNSVYQVMYEHPSYEVHRTVLLSGLVRPSREVDDYEIYHVNRRFFNGENAVRMLERVLGIDASVSAIYKPMGYQNNQGRYEGVREVRQGQGVEDQLGKRRQREYNEEDRGGQHRSRYDNNQGGNYGGQYNSYRGGQQNYGNYYQQNYSYYQQQQYYQAPQQNINYNIGRNYQQNYNQQYYDQQQQYQQQPSQIPQQQTQSNVLVGPPQNNLMNLLAQLNTTPQQPNQQQIQDQQKKQGNRFQGFME